MIDVRKTLCDYLHIVFASHLWGNNCFHYFSAKMWNRQRRLHRNSIAVRVITLISFRTDTNGAILCPFPSWMKTRFRRQCLQSNGAQIGHAILSGESWYILRENSSILMDWFMLFNFGNRVFCFLPFLSRLRDWLVLKSEKNRDDLFNNRYHRLFGATLAAEMAPLSVPNCSIL